MKHEIHQIPPRAAARIVGAVGGALALTGMLLTWLVSFFLPVVVTFKSMPIALAVLVVPVGWWLTLYLCTWVVCGMYNLCARHFGGIMLVVGDSTAAQRTN